MKRLLSALFTLLIILTVITGCTQTPPTAAPSESGSDDGKLNVVCTIFPQYDWVKQVLGNRADNINLTLLLANGVDLHSYQPSVDDIMTISNSDVFIYVGGESDAWVTDALAQAQNPDMVVINMLEKLGDAAKEEEIIEGMQPEAEEEEEEEGPVYDEHVWLSLRNAQIISKAIADAFSTLDAENAQEYKANLDAYTEKLTDLDARYKAAFDAGNVKTLLFADRFPFRYLTDDYGIDYFAAFPGCSTDTEASFETLTFLTNKVNELKLTKIMVIETGDQSIAKTIIDNTSSKDQQILVLDSVQSITSDDINNGVTYLSIMESNLEVLTEAVK